MDTRIQHPSVPWRKNLFPQVLAPSDFISATESHKRMLIIQGNSSKYWLWHGSASNDWSRLFSPLGDNPNEIEPCTFQAVFWDCPRLCWDCSTIQFLPLPNLNPSPTLFKGVITNKYLTWKTFQYLLLDIPICDKHYQQASPNWYFLYITANNHKTHIF